MTAASGGTMLVLLIALGIGLFFLMRGLILWYLRINELCDHLKVQNWLLAKMAGYPVPTVINGKVVFDPSEKAAIDAAKVAYPDVPPRS